jgi:CSLREA domain-containing protein/LPXTG-motif cell wall-anchored protein
VALTLVIPASRTEAQTPAPEFPLVIPPACQPVGGTYAFGANPLNPGDASAPCRIADPNVPVTPLDVTLSPGTATVTFSSPHTTADLPGCIKAGPPNIFGASCTAVTNHAAAFSASWPERIDMLNCPANGAGPCTNSYWSRTLYEATFVQRVRSGPLANTTLHRIGTCGMVTGGAGAIPLADTTCSYQVVNPPGQFANPALTSFSFGWIGVVPGADGVTNSFVMCPPGSGCIGLKNVFRPRSGDVPESTGTMIFLRSGPTVTGPTADFTISTTSIADEYVVDAAPSLAAAQTTITGYDWTFDDGTNATGRTFTHRFPTTGTHAITLTVTASDGKTASVTKQTPTVLELVVNSTGDASDSDDTDQRCDTGGTVGSDPECTLRAAIETTNRASATRITFALAGTPTITLGSLLPEIRKPTTIDGSGQPGVKIAGAGLFGLSLHASTIVKAITIDGFENGISIFPTAPNSVVAATTITNAAVGISAQAAGLRVGGSNEADGNRIGARVMGIWTGPGTTIEHNRIGQQADTVPTFGILTAGVGATTAASTVRNNLVRASAAAIWVAGTSPAATVVEANRVGFDANGAATQRADAGVVVDGTPGVIVRTNRLYARCGVIVNGSLQGAVTDDGNGNVQFRSTGCSESVDQAATTSTGVSITDNTIGVLGDGITPTPEAGSDGIRVRAKPDQVTMTGNNIDNVATGIEADGNGHRVFANRIGVVAATRRAPMQIGIRLFKVLDAQVGEPGRGNVIGNATTAALQIIGSASGRAVGISVQGNSFGMDDTTAVPNGNGVVIDLASDIDISGNVISANTRSALMASEVDGLTVAANAIGVDQSRQTAVSNETGIIVGAPPGRRNGRVTIGPDNVIAATTGGPMVTGVAHAVDVSNAQIVRVTSNVIGLDGTGQRALGNQGGIFVTTSSDVQIDANTASAAEFDALTVSNVDTLRVEGNRIGTASTGTTVLGNRNGVVVSSTKSVTITGNTIAGNRAAGITVQAQNILNVKDNVIGVVGAGSARAGNDIGLAVFGGTEGEISGNTMSANRVGMQFDRIGAGVAVRDNRIGTSVDGSRAVGNRIGVLISVDTSTAVIGSGNLIAANTEAGISTSAGSLRISNSSFGIGSSGQRLGNEAAIVASDGAVRVQGSRIANSARSGLISTAGARIEADSTAFYDNAGPAIAITPDPPTPPILVAAPRSGAGDDTTTWIVARRVPADGRLEIFANPTCDGDPEGRVPIRSILMPDPLLVGDGLVYPLHGQPDLRAFTVTFTSNGRTTNFSNCVEPDPSAPDSDRDGVPDQIEQIGGSADIANDPKRTALPIEGRGWVGLIGSGALSDVGVREDPAPLGHPGVQLPFGTLGFTVAAGSDGRATVSVATPSGVADGYWKYGTIADTGTLGWYRFDVDTASGTGATRSSVTTPTGVVSVFELSFVDGRRGDSDGVRNGRIVDPGAPGIGSLTQETPNPPAATTPATATPAPTTPAQATPAVTVPAITLPVAVPATETSTDPLATTLPETGSSGGATIASLAVALISLGGVLLVARRRRPA